MTCSSCGPLSSRTFASVLISVSRIVAVDRADVVEAELLEQRAGKHHALHVLFPALGELLHRRQLGEHFLAAAADGVVGAAGQQPREVIIERADRLRDRHVVVVEDHQQVGAGGAGIVERLERHPGAHRAVADHRDHGPLLALQPRGDGHAERRRDRRRRMRGAERVVRDFRSRRGKPDGPSAIRSRLIICRRPVRILCA